MRAERIMAEDGALCILVRDFSSASETSFVTDAANSLQVGAVAHPAGHEIARHQHEAATRTVGATEEVVFVLRGRCEVDVYDDRRARVATETLDAGDLLIMLRGGHGFRMLEDTVILELKQGPYLGPQEKVQF